MWSPGKLVFQIALSSEQRRTCSDLHYGLCPIHGGGTVPRGVPTVATDHPQLSPSLQISGINYAEISRSCIAPSKVGYSLICNSRVVLLRGSLLMNQLRLESWLLKNTSRVRTESSFLNRFSFLFPEAIATKFSRRI